jgi:hypothetical protein
MNRRRFLKAAGVSMALPLLDIDAASRDTGNKVRPDPHGNR